MMLLFLSAMLALLIAGLIADQKWLTGAVAVLLVNWLAEVAMVQCSGDQYPWLFFLVADYLSALAIIAIKINRWQIAVSVIYAMQIVCHAGYGLSYQGLIAQYNYWWVLTYTGWCQLAVLAGGSVYALVRRFRSTDRSVSHSSEVLGRSGGEI